MCASLIASPGFVTDGKTLSDIYIGSSGQKSAIVNLQWTVNVAGKGVRAVTIWSRFGQLQSGSAGNGIGWIIGWHRSRIG